MTDIGHSPDTHIPLADNLSSNVVEERAYGGSPPSVQKIATELGLTLPSQDKESLQTSSSISKYPTDWTNIKDQIKGYKVTTDSQSFIAELKEKISIHPDVVDYIARFEQAGGKIIAINDEKERRIGAFISEKGVIFINTAFNHDILAPSLAHELRHAVHHHIDLGLSDMSIERINDYTYTAAYAWIYSIEADAQAFSIDVSYRMAENGDTSGLRGVKELQHIRNQAIDPDVNYSTGFMNNVDAIYIYDVQQAYAIQMVVTPDRHDLATARAFDAWFTSKDAPKAYQEQVEKIYEISLNTIGYSTDVSAYIKDNNIQHDIGFKAPSSTWLKKLGVVDGKNYMKFVKTNMSKDKYIRQQIPNYNADKEQSYQNAINSYVQDGILPVTTLSNGFVKSYSIDSKAEYTTSPLKTDLDFTTYMTYKEQGDLDYYQSYKESEFLEKMDFETYRMHQKYDVLQYYNDYQERIASNASMLDTETGYPIVTFNDYSELRRIGLLEKSTADRTDIPNHIQNIVQMYETSGYMTYLYAAVLDTGNKPLINAMENLYIKIDTVIQEDKEVINYNNAIMMQEDWSEDDLKYTLGFTGEDYKIVLENIESFLALQDIQILHDLLGENSDDDGYMSPDDNPLIQEVLEEIENLISAGTDYMSKNHFNDSFNTASKPEKSSTDMAYSSLIKQPSAKI